MKKKDDIAGEKSLRGGQAKRPHSAAKSESFVRDAVWEREREWFAENRHLDPLALFAKYYSGS
jgi:hypothetical protein